MTLELPADAEPFIVDEWDQLHDSGVYCLVLSRPANPAAAWDAVHDARPAWFEAFVSAREVWYVGSAKDILARLEDHRDGHQSSVLMDICEIDGLRNIWWCDADRRREVESQTAIMLRNYHPETFVRQA